MRNLFISISTLFGVIITSPAFSASFCTTGNKLTGTVTSYGIDSSGKYTEIAFKASDGTYFPSLINKTMPLNTDSGKAIDNVVLIAYTTMGNLQIICTATNQFFSVSLTTGN